MVFKGLKAGMLVLTGEQKYIWACVLMTMTSCICMHMEAGTVNSTVKPTTW